MTALLDVLRTILPERYSLLGQPAMKLILVSNGTHLIAKVDVRMQAWTLVDGEGNSRWTEGPEHGVWGGPYLDGKWRFRLAEKLKDALMREETP